MSLTLIGDPRQTLYLFRHAEPDILTHMDKLLPGTQKGHILKNYRSPKQLVCLSNKMAESFKEDFGEDFEIKDSVPHNPDGNNVISISDFQSVTHEAGYVAREISNLVRRGVQYEDISILSRTNRQLLEFEAGLITEKIPYIIKYDSRSILNQSSFKVMYSIYSLMFNPKDINALCEVIKPIKGIGAKFLEQLRQALSYELSIDINFSIFNKVNVFTLKSKTKQYQSLYNFMENILVPIRETFMGEDISFIGFNMEVLDILTKSIKFEGDNNSNKELSLTIERDFFVKTISTFSKIYKIMSEDIEFQRYSSVNKFFSIYQTIQMSQEVYESYRGDKGSEDSKRAVTLYTVHSYKGKENDYIFGVHLKSYVTVDDWDFSNKCVFYVLVTRARKKLYLTSSRYIRSFKGDLIRSAPNYLLEQYKREVSKLREKMEDQI